MTKVICDTNIWYNLGNGSLKFENSDKYALCFTYLSLFELIHSANLKDDFKKVSKACKAVITYSSCFIIESPLNHLINLLHPLEFRKSNSNFIEAITYLSSIDDLDKDILLELDKHLSSHNDKLDKYFVTYISEQMASFKNVIYKDRTSTFKYKELIKTRKMKEGKFENLKCQIIQEIGDISGISKSYFSEKFWKQIEVFLKSWAVYTDKLKFDKTMNPKPNDAADLTNLVYVNEDNLYWTEDRRWINILKEAKLEKYMFQNKAPDSAYLIF